jgi:2-oxoglutarate ferredoxin oxidoreductase subunit gamma
VHPCNFGSENRVFGQEHVHSPYGDESASLEKFEGRVKSNGLLAINETRIDSPTQPEDVRIIRIPVNGIVSDLGDSRVANMAAIGGLVEALGMIAHLSLSKGLQQVVPKYRHHLIPLNEEAMRRGM